MTKEEIANFERSIDSCVLAEYSERSILIIISRLLLRICIAVEK